MTRIIIGLTGPIGAGKSSAALRLEREHGFTHRAFAYPLKAMLVTLLRCQDVGERKIWRMLNGDLKEEPSPHLGGATPRAAMQRLGTEWGRSLHPDLWVEVWAAGIGGLPRVVADDVRFPNEAAIIRALGGRILRIERGSPSSPAERAEASDAHVSELIAAAIEPDEVVVNSGSIEQFMAQVARAAGVG